MNPAPNLEQQLLRRLIELGEEVPLLNTQREALTFLAAIKSGRLICLQRDSSTPAGW